MDSRQHDGQRGTRRSAGSTESRRREQVNDSRGGRGSAVPHVGTLPLGVGRARAGPTANASPMFQPDHQVVATGELHDITGDAEILHHYNEGKRASRWHVLWRIFGASPAIISCYRIQAFLLVPSSTSRTLTSSAD